MPCMCGATDCPSCGPAQGYTVYKKFDVSLRMWVWVNPPDECPRCGTDVSEQEIDEEDGLVCPECGKRI